jgi:hypothetical protein
MCKIKIDCVPITNRQPVNSTKEYRKFVIVGGHHAEKTAVKLREKGHGCQYVAMPHYRSSAIFSGKILDCLADLRMEEGTVLILQVFDSGMFWARTEDGSLIPPCRRADGSYHIDGEFEIIKREMQYDLFKHLMSELLDHKDKPLIFLAPLPRYLEEGCCQDSDHVANRKNPDYKKKQEEAIYNARQNIKNFAFRQNVKNCVTISAWTKIKRLSIIWAGPTSLVDEGYEKLAEAVVEAAEDLQKKRRTSSEAGGPPKKKARTVQQTGTIHGAVQPENHASGGRGARGGRGGRGGAGQRPRGAWRDDQPPGNMGHSSHRGGAASHSGPGPHKARGWGGHGVYRGRGSRPWRGYRGNTGGYY